MIQRVIRFAEYMDVYVVHNFLDMNTLVNVILMNMLLRTFHPSQNKFTYMFLHIYIVS